MGSSDLKKKAKELFYSIELGEGDVAIDCGANVGTFTGYFAAKGARVYAFEPNPYAFASLHQRATTFKNVTCYPKAVGIENSKQSLYFHRRSDEDEVHWSTGSSLLSGKGNVSKHKFFTVGVIDLVEFINSLNTRVKILKIDIEGTECPLIKKIIETDTISKIDYMFVETHDHKIPMIKEETDEIRQLIRSRNITNINLDWE